MSNGAHIVLVGAFGGMFPTLLRLAIDLSQDKVRAGDLHGSMLLAMAIFAVCGGFVAGIWGETDLKKVFYLGIGLPSFLTVLTSSASAQALAYAQTQPHETPSQLTLSLPPDVVASGAQVAFKSVHGTSIVPFKPTLPVPAGTTSFSVSSPRGDSGELPLSQSSVTLQAQPNPWFGLKYAFGVSGAKPEKLVPKGAP